MGGLKVFWYPLPNWYRRQACAHPRKLNIKAPKFVGIPPSEKFTQTEYFNILVYCQNPTQSIRCNFIRGAKDLSAMDCIKNLTSCYSLKILLYRYCNLRVDANLP